MKCQILFSEKNKKNISKCRLLKILPRVLSVKCCCTWRISDLIASQVVPLTWLLALSSGTFDIDPCTVKWYL